MASTKHIFYLEQIFHDLNRFFLFFNILPEAVINIIRSVSNRILMHQLVVTT